MFSLHFWIAQLEYQSRKWGKFLKNCWKPGSRTWHAKMWAALGCCQSMLHFSFQFSETPDHRPPPLPPISPISQSNGKRWGQTGKACVNRKTSKAERGGKHTVLHLQSLSQQGINYAISKPTATTEQTYPVDSPQPPS